MWEGGAAASSATGLLASGHVFDTSTCKFQMGTGALLHTVLIGPVGVEDRVFFVCEGDTCRRGELSNSAAFISSYHSQTRSLSP